MRHWKELVRLSEEELSRLDVAEVNLACAAELPGAPTPFQVRQCIDRLNRYAKCVRRYTDERMPEFRAKPEVYDGSESVFRVVSLVRVVQGKFGVRYNPAKRPPDAPLETADTFIHGALVGEGGTCASLPVVFAAVGRRLGYPLKLVSTKCHLFFRWDEPGGERLNFQESAESMDVLPDDYFRTGRYQLEPDEEKYGRMLLSQTPRAELSNFMAERGFRWLDYGNDRQATEAFAWASALHPEDRLLWNRFVMTWNARGERLQKLQPKGSPEFYFTWPPRRFPETLPLRAEKEIILMEAWENILNTPELDAQWWEPMRQGRPVSPRPVAAIVVCHASGGCNIRYKVAR